jgi:hypothetical protein
VVPGPRLGAPLDFITTNPTLAEPHELGNINDTQIDHKVDSNRSKILDRPTTTKKKNPPFSIVLAVQYHLWAYFAAKVPRQFQALTDFSVHTQHLNIFKH